MSAPIPPAALTDLLFYTSRSARDLQFFCPFKRYLANHFGPSGYGIQPAAKSVPLVTGGSFHNVMKPALEWVVAHDQPPPPDVVMEAAANELEAYRARVAAKGVAYWDDNPEQYRRMVSENEHLIVGLPLVWLRHQLPLLLQDWRIVFVEPREVSVYRCTCGLGDAIPPHDTHVARGCQGIAIQTGPDFIAQHRHTQSYRYDEFKTRNNYLTDAWAESYETRVQVQLGTLGVEQKHGILIEQVYLHGLHKGVYRKAGKKSEIVGEYQDSRLCWAWRKRGAPPLTDDEWAYKYEWFEEDPDSPGEWRKRRLGKGWERTWVGEFPGGLPAWIEQLPETAVADMLRTVGPLQRNPVAKADALESWVLLEEHNQDALYVIYAALEQTTPPFDWTDDTVQHLLRKHFPKSWECQAFGARYACEFKPICHHYPGWRDPFTIGFVNRRPHHPHELAQAISRGCVLPDEGYEAEEPL